MSWLLSIVIGAGRFARSVARWLFNDWRRVIALLVVAVIGWQWMTIRHLNGAIAERDQRVVAMAAAHRAELDRINRATQAAVRADAANRARVEAEWQAHLMEADRENQVLRDRYRIAVAQFVRSHSSRSDPDSSGRPATDVPSSAALPGQPLHDAATTVIPVRDAELCADAFAQLAALILAWQGASGVDVNGVFSGSAEPVKQ